MSITKNKAKAKKDAIHSIRRSKRLVNDGILPPSHRISCPKFKNEKRSKCIEDLPLEIISHIHSFLPSYDLRTRDHTSFDLVCTIPRHALCCKDWFRVWVEDKNRSIKFHSGREETKRDSLEERKSIKLMMLSQIGFTGTIYKLLTLEMFDVLDLFISSRHFDSTHDVWKKARILCDFKGIERSTAFLDKHGL